MADGPAPSAGGAAATDNTPRRPIGDVWERTGWIVIAFAFAIGFEVRRNLLTEPGLRGDLDQFVGWVHHIAVHGLGTLYSGTDAGPVTFGPVMAYVWAALAAIQPAFATATDASDPLIRAFMKAPASIADLALAGIAAYALRRHRKWAALAVVAILFHPAVIDVSAWWGQYESIFVGSAFAALVLAINGHDRPAAALVAISLMTKPQALPFVLPFAAWFWASGYHRIGADGKPGGARGGVIELVQTGLIGLATIAVLWLPFLAEGGPVNYLRNLATYQGEIFSVISVRAWNVWWLVQILGAPDGSGFVADDIAFLGPLTLRHVGFLVTGLLSLVVVWAIVRDPRPRTLILGLTASVLVFFSFMTQMHERYAYAAVIFLVLLLPETRPRWLWVAFGVAFTLNLLAAVPPTPAIAERLPVGGALGVAGALVMIAITVLTLREMTTRRVDDSRGAAILAG
jgi:Gpi18-like mannosyltransferase